MTHEEILQKAIERAYFNGLDCPFIKNANYGKEFYVQIIKDYTHVALIFDHSFAKAFWPDQHKFIPRLNRRTVDQQWRRHIKKMVLDPDPIRYLEKFL